MTYRQVTQRASANYPVRIYTASGGVYKATLSKVSATGLAILFTAPADVGTKLMLQFNLFVNNKQKNIKVGCTVVNSYLKGNRYHIGVTYFWNSEEQENDILAYIEERNNIESIPTY